MTSDVAAPEQEVEDITAEWIFVGYRWSGRPEHKLYQCWRDEHGKERVWTKGGITTSAGQPGALYEITYTPLANGATSVYMSGGKKGPRYIRTLSEDEEPRRVEWTLADRAARASERMHKQKKADAKQDVLKDALQPLREIWLHTDATGRRAMLATIIEYFTFGGYS